MTFLELANETLSRSYPARFSSRLVEQRRWAVQQGLIDLQRRVPCLRDNVVSYLCPCDPDPSGATVLCAPDGKLNMIYVAKADDTCRIEPGFVSPGQMHAMMRDYQRDYCGCPPPKQVEDACFPPARINYTIDKANLLLFPWIPSGWKVVLRTDGIRSGWADSDVVPDLSATELEALRRYVVAEGSFEDGCMDMYEARRAAYQEQAIIARWECQRKQTPERTFTYPENELRTPGAMLTPSAAGCCTPTTATANV